MPLRATRSRLRFGVIAALASLCAGMAGSAPDRVAFTVSGSDKGLARDLRGVSVLLAAQKDKSAEAQDLFAEARAEYANLLGALYARGHYAPVIHVLIDGREAAEIAPLDAPAQIQRIEVKVDPGPVFAFSQTRVAPLAPETVLPERFAPREVAESGLVLEAVGAAVDGWRHVGHAKAASAEERLLADHAAATLSVDVRMEPGPRLRFGRLVIEGNQRMRPGRIRAITGLPEGAVFDDAELARATSRLRRTGIFRSVTLKEAETITPPDLLGITAVVVEEKPRRYTFGAEIASLEGLALTGSWLHRNLFGGGERLTISGNILNIGAQTGGTDYGIGVLLERPATLTPDTTARLGFEVEHLDEADFSSDGFAVNVGFNQVFSDSLTGSAVLAYEFARITDASGTTNYRNLALPLGLIWDRRDSVIDAREGFLLQGEVKPFLGFGAAESGARLTLDARGYRAIGAEQAVVLALRAQAGAILAAGVEGTPRNDLFYSGGGGTVRGQPFQSLGVDVLRDGNGDLFTTGGTLFLGGSAEARVRVTENIGVVGFVDVGRIDSGSFFSDAGGWQAGAGIGVRYATLVGPIRLDVAVPAGGGTGRGVQFYIGLGQAF